MPEQDTKAYLNMLGTFTKGDPEAEAIEARWKLERTARYICNVGKEKGVMEARKLISEFDGDQEALRNLCNEYRGVK